MIVLIGVVLIQGFLLAWVAQLIAHEEVEVKTGVGIVLAAGLISAIAGWALVEPIGALLAALGQLGIYFGVLSLLLRFAAHLEWKHSTIIATIYTVLYLAIVFGLAFLLSKA